MSDAKGVPREFFDTAYEGAPHWEIGRPQADLVRLFERGGSFKGKVLDVGCGSGENSLFLASKGLEVVGIDRVPAAIERTCARLTGSAGRNGGCGIFSFRYSMIASDCESTTPSSSSAGIRPCGFTPRYSGARCSRFAKTFAIDSYFAPLRFRAMRTRKAAELRKNV